MTLQFMVTLGLSTKLTELENYETESEHEYALIGKLFFFIYFDGYLWYWILAFVHIPLVMNVDCDTLRQIDFFGLPLFGKCMDENFWIASFQTSIAMQQCTTNLAMLVIENILPL